MGRKKKEDINLEERLIEKIKSEDVEVFSIDEKLSIEEIEKKHKLVLEKTLKQSMRQSDESKIIEHDNLSFIARTLTDDIANDTDFISRIKDSCKSAMDFKFLMEALRLVNSERSNAKRLDTIDGAGNARALKISTKFNLGNGTSVSSFLEIDSEDLNVD